MPGGGVVSVPVGWLAEYADIGATSPRVLADALVRVGLEVEQIEAAGEAISGPLVLGRVVSYVDEPQRNGKVVRWCAVDVGEHNTADGPRGIVCGAHNFAVGDLVAVALPGTVLPGPFAISARKTYGHVSDGMICSARELGIGQDAAGILVLPSSAGAPGEDARGPLGLTDDVLTIAVTPDRGYCLSVRGLSREAATALDAGYRDVAASVAVPAPDGGAYDVRVEDPAGCDRFSARAVRGLAPNAASPNWLQARLRQVGMRPISLAVDVTNYVMLETGQPLHAFDRARLSGPVVVRRARPGERLTTLDGVERALDPEDLLVTDDTGPIALAGVMGGASTEVSDTTTDIVLEAAHWDPSVIARAVRRHRLPSEAAKRFERGVDPEIAAVALQRCVDLLAELGGAVDAGGVTVVGDGPAPAVVTMSAAYPGRLAGLEIPTASVVRRLEQVGCHVSVASGTDELTVRAPSWRPDLRMPADLVEEVVRLEGYDRVPSALPTPPPGRGLTDLQRTHRAVRRALAASGYTEALGNPFVSPRIWDDFGLPSDDPRRRAPFVANPLSDAEPQLRSTLLPGLLTILLRNIGRGTRDLALYEIGQVFGPTSDLPPVPRPGVAHRPSDAELAALHASVPDQPRHAAVVLAGELERRGWWGPGRAATWADAVEAARTVARTCRVELTVRRGESAPWHPGRCAELVLDARVVGYAGELHPRVTAALDLPPRSCAMELDLAAFPAARPVTAPHLSTFPPVLLDVALVVGQEVPAADVEAALREGGGELLESVRLFDVYRGLGGDAVSLAFSLRLRAPDRTLTVEEATGVRDAAVALAGQRTGAVLRA